MQNNTIELLAWDSEFFGYPVARVSLNHEGIGLIDDLFRQIESRKIHITYFIVSPSDQAIIDKITKNGGVLADQKTIYSKESEKHDNISGSISEFNGTEINEKLKELALQAGLFSRFRLDGNFKNNEYEKLYTEWLRKSVNRSIAFKTLVSVQGSEITGFVTLVNKTSYIDIGLVSVDKNFRGKGIGVDLIRYADSIAYEMGKREIKVTTQLDNTPACRLYEKCGFRIESINNIYHYWL
jgi:dTDP-4-amino-4,6-dideoxy-D-galactose acyltransferase